MFGAILTRRKRVPPAVSSVNSHEWVPGSPNGKLPRLAIETDPVRDAFGASDNAEISRTPGADYDCALIICQRSLSHLDLSHSSPTTQMGERRIVGHAFQSDKTPLSHFREGRVITEHFTESIFGRQECIP